MIWSVYIAIALALGVLFLMRGEILNGYFRWRDYLVAAPLLYGVGAMLFFLNTGIPVGSGIWVLFVMVVRLCIAFGIMVVVWGGTLAAGALIMRLLGAVFLRRA